MSTAVALAAQVTQKSFDKVLIFPSFTYIWKLSTHIAANVAAKAYELGEHFFSPDCICAFGTNMKPTYIYIIIYIMKLAIA